MKLQPGGVLKYSYYMQAEGSNISTAFKTASTAENTVKVNYKSNKNWDHTAESSASLKVTRPKLTKELDEANSSDEEQVWKVTIDLGSLGDMGLSLEDINPTFVENCPGLVPLTTLTAASFASTTLGVYEATYKTKLENPLLESKTYTNTLTVRTDYGDYKGSDTYTSDGVLGASISKTAIADSFDSSDRTIKWQIVLSGINPGFTDVKVKEEVINNYGEGEHEWIHTITVNGHKVLDNGVLTSENTIDVGGTSVKILAENVYLWGYSTPIDYTTSDTLYFSDEFIQSLTDGKITLDYVTNVNDLTSEGLTYRNKATLSYKDSSDALTDTADYTVPTVDRSGEPLEKTGVTTTTFR